MPRRILKAECPEEYEVMHLPSKFWGAVQDSIPKLALNVLTKLIDDADTYCRRGYVMVVYGSPRSGKSSAAAVVAKKTMETGLRALWSTPSMLQDAVRWDFDFSQDRTYLFHAKQVSLLIIDDLSDADYGNKYFTQKDYRDLIVRRAENGRSTIITTADAPAKWQWIYDALPQHFVGVECKGMVSSSPGVLQTPVADSRSSESSEARKARMVKDWGF